MDADSREVFVNGRSIALTKIEFDLLEALTQSPRVVLTHERLVEVISGSSWFGEGHGLEVHISRLRSKLGESGQHPVFIRTVRGVGYRFDPNPGRNTQSHKPRSQSAEHRRAFEEEWARCRALPETTWVSRDGSLTVSAIEHPEQGFFGWNGSMVLGDYFTLNPIPSLYLNRDAGVRLIQALASSGHLLTSERLPVRSFDGDIAWAHGMRRIFLTPHGFVSGVEALVRPWPPSKESLDTLGPL